MAVDKDTTLRTKPQWARPLVKKSNKVRPTSFIVLVGSRSYEVQIWWEISPWVAEVFLVRRMVVETRVGLEVGDKWKKSASQHVKVGVGGNPRLKKGMLLNVLEQEEVIRPDAVGDLTLQQKA